MITVLGNISKQVNHRGGGFQKNTDIKHKSGDKHILDVNKKRLVDLLKVQISLYCKNWSYLAMTTKSDAF